MFQEQGETAFIHGVEESLFGQPFLDSKLAAGRITHSDDVDDLILNRRILEDHESGSPGEIQGMFDSGVVLVIPGDRVFAIFGADLLKAFREPEEVIDLPVDEIARRDQQVRILGTDDVQDFIEPLASYNQSEVNIRNLYDLETFDVRWKFGCFENPPFNPEVQGGEISMDANRKHRDRAYEKRDVTRNCEERGMALERPAGNKAEQPEEVKSQ